MEPLVSIALATYNGEKYLRDQLNSIYQQSYSNLEVVASDDRSSDATIRILDEFAETYGLRYAVNDRRLGVVRNFEAAIKMSRGSYVALADQDDIWATDKIAMLQRRAQTLEASVGRITPVLVFSDLIVVDENLSEICRSYYAFTKKNATLTTLNRLIVENVVVGCTTLFNQTLAELALPFPEEATMHDLWLALVCSAFGKIEPERTPTTYYRQHGGNVLGARNKAGWVTKALRKVSSPWLDNVGYREQFEPCRRQVTTFLRRFGEQLSQEQVRMLTAYVHMQDDGFLMRRYRIVRNRFFKNGFWDNVEMLIRA